jgi:hypothetical protein
MTDEGKFSDTDKRIILFELQKTFKSKVTVCNKIVGTMITSRSRRNSSGRSRSISNHDDDNNNYVGDYNDDGDIDANNNDNNQMTTMMLIQNNILYYFYYDNFSSTNQIILNYKANRDDDHDDFNINNYVRIIYSIILLLLLFMMIGYLFYFVLYLIRTSLYQQQIYIYSFCISIIIDSFMIQLIIIMFCDVILPLIIMKDVHCVKEILLDCMIIQKNRNDNNNNNHQNHNDNNNNNNNNLKSQRSSRITAPTAVNQSGFNTANYYYISRLLAKEFESFIESKLISIYHTTNPMISSRITKKASDKEYYKYHYHYPFYYCMVGFYIITTIISNILSSVMLLFLQSPKFFQEFIIQSSASVIFSMAIIVTLNFYHIYKFYSFIPLIVLTMIMILWVRFTAYYDYMRRFKLYQHLALLLNVRHLFKEKSNLQIVNDGNKTMRRSVLSSSGSDRIVMNQERSRAHHTKKVNNVQSGKALSSRNRRSNSIRQIASSIQNLFSVRLKNPTIVTPMLSSLSIRNKDHSVQDEFSDSSNSFGGRRFSMDKSVRAVLGGVMNVARGSTKYVDNKGKIKNDNDVEANIYQLSDSDEEDDKDIYQLSDSDEEKINQSSDANNGDEYYIDDEDDVSIHENDNLSSDESDFDNDNNLDNYDIYKDNEDSDSISYESDCNDDDSCYDNNDNTDVVNGHDDDNNYSYDDVGDDNSSNSNIHSNRLIVRNVVDDYSKQPLHVVKVKRSSFSDSMQLSKIQEELSKDDESSC